MTTPANPDGFEETVHEYIKSPPTWDHIMANALANFTHGQTEMAAFLVQYATEMRRMEICRDEKFEAIRQEMQEMDER